MSQAMRSSDSGAQCSSSRSERIDGAISRPWTIPFSKSRVPRTCPDSRRAIPPLVPDDSIPRTLMTSSEVYAGGLRSQDYNLRIITDDFQGLPRRAGVCYIKDPNMKLSRIKKLSWKLFLVYGLLVTLIFFADRRVEKWTLWNFWVGLALIAASCWLRIWASGHLVKNKVLTVTGPYAYVKNPLYIGTFLGMVGTAFLTMGDPRQRQVWYYQHMN